MARIMENKTFEKDFSSKLASKAILDAYAYRAMPKVDKEKSANELAEEIRNGKDAYVDKAVDVVLVYSQYDITTQPDIISQRDWKMYTLMDMVKKGFIACDDRGNDESPKFRPVSMESALAAVSMHCGISALCVQALNGTGPVLDLVKSVVDIYTQGGFFMVKR